MAETLGSLTDKLTIVKLKQYHSTDDTRKQSLAQQEQRLIAEINGFAENALCGNIPLRELSFSANKVYNKQKNIITAAEETNIGAAVSKLADTNCALWHVQEYVYEFDTVPAQEKDGVIKQLALLNLERNKYIDEIDRLFTEVCKHNKSAKRR